MYNVGLLKEYSISISRSRVERYSYYEKRKRILTEKREEHDAPRQTHDEIPQEVVGGAPMLYPFQLA